MNKVHIFILIGKVPGASARRTTSSSTMSIWKIRSSDCSWHFLVHLHYITIVIKLRFISLTFFFLVYQQLGMITRRLAAARINNTLSKSLYSSSICRNYSSDASRRHKAVYREIYPAMIRIGVVAMIVYYVGNIRPMYSAS